VYFSKKSDEIEMRILVTLLTTLHILNVFAQQDRQKAFTFDYNYQIPKGVLAERFGDNSSITASYFFEKPNNFFYGIEASYMFGNNVKDTNIFDNISTESGAIIGGDGYYANVNLMERGFDSYVFVGYALHAHNSRTLFFPYLHRLAFENLSGIYVSTGIGYLQHKIFIDTKNQNIPQLNEEYKKGYDKLSGGISTKLSIDYKYYSKKGNVQFSIGVNYITGFTKNQREYLFNEMSYTTEEKILDQLIGFKFGVIIPVQRKNQEEFHYY